MNFTEFSFWWTVICIGLPLLCVRWGVRRTGWWSRRWDQATLLVLSLALFYNASPPSLVILLVEIGLNFLALRVLPRVGPQGRLALVVTVVTLDLTALAYFKYLEFFLGDFLQVLTFGQLSLAYDTVLPGVPAIPPGISFYTFQMVAMLVDTYRDPKAGKVSVIDYANFAAFFPQIVAGPIERRSHLLPQMQHFRFRFVPQWIENGFRWVVLGLFLKLVLANNLADHIRFEETANPFGILTATYLFGLRIYFDFAGYSLIALGLAKMLGIRLSLNFRAPYAARSLREFWHRWHVTLSNWFRDYVYFPLGGSRGPFWALNLMIVFTVSGLWHGAGWNFVIWGAYHGVLLTVQRALMRDGAQPEPSRPITEAVKWAGTYVLAMFGWLFFMETDWVQLTAKLRTLADSASYSMSAAREVVSGFGSVDLATLGLALLLAHVVLGLEMASRRKDETANPYRVLLTTPAVVCMLVGLFWLTARSPSQFIYFAF